MCDDVVYIPITGTDMQSLNVGVSAALVFYCLMNQRKEHEPLPWRYAPDVLILDPSAPYDLGCILRTLWCFNWDRVYLRDSHHLWYGNDTVSKNAILEASGGHRNHTKIAPFLQSRAKNYESAFIMTECEGTPLSRMNFADRGRAVLVFPGDSGSSDVPDGLARRVEPFFVDFPSRKVKPLFRTSVSTVLMDVRSIFR